MCWTTKDFLKVLKVGEVVSFATSVRVNPTPNAMKCAEPH